MKDKGDSTATFSLFPLYNKDSVRWTPMNSFTTVYSVYTLLHIKRVYSVGKPGFIWRDDAIAEKDHGFWSQTGLG